MINCRAVWKKICLFFSLSDDIPVQPEIPYEELVRQAYEDVKHAYNVFENVEDMILTEYAIYSVKAAEKRYEYLLKKLRSQQNISNPCV